MNNDRSNEQQWQLLVLLLKEIAIAKYGIGWQAKLVEKTNFSQGNMSRIFSLKYIPSLSNFLKIASALEVYFFFEDKESKTDLNLCFEKAMNNLGRRINQDRNN